MSLILGYEIDEQAAAQIFGNFANKLCNRAVEYGGKKVGEYAKKIKWNEEQ